MIKKDFEKFSNIFLEDGKYLKLPKNKKIRFFYLYLFMLVGTIAVIVYLEGRRKIENFILSIIFSLLK